VIGEKSKLVIYDQIKYLPYGENLVKIGPVDPAHWASKTFQFLQLEILEFILPDFWPRNSPDLHHDDCRIWKLVWQERLQAAPHW